VDSADLPLLRPTAELLLMAGPVEAMAVEAMATHLEAEASPGGRLPPFDTLCSSLDTFSTRYNT
jgi:hypothetical protein